MRTLHHDHQGRALSKPLKRYRGLDHYADIIHGKQQRRRSQLSRWEQQAQEISDRALLHCTLTQRELSQQLLDCKATFRRQSGQVDNQQLNAAYSFLVEAADRCLGTRPYKVQIVAALALHSGCLAEMATGEGKTLTAALPAILTAWSSKPCHLVTANDYLARRDAEALTPLYSFCSVTTGWIRGDMPSELRRKNYLKNVVYTTGKELLADFLRDRLLIDATINAERLQLQRYLGKIKVDQQPVLRGIDTAIIDEADSVLIDDATTPLIISKPQTDRHTYADYQRANKIALELSVNSDYQMDYHYQEIQLTQIGREKIAKRSSVSVDYSVNAKQVEEFVLTALIAKEFFQEKRNYVVVDKKVVIVDEFTGRMMPERSWRQGLHQAIETKENLPLSKPNETLAQLSFQNFFRLFNNLAGLTGTAKEVQNEFWSVYRLPVIAIPTNRSCLRIKHPKRFFLKSGDKWQAICCEVKRYHANEQPVLVGTRSVQDSESLSSMLTKMCIPHRLLNATHHEDEADIIATAGMAGQVIIATNMAGRGADIKLDAEVAAKGGLHVIVAEPHRSKRIDRQLEGRCARQGEPGSTQQFASTEDLLFTENLPVFFTLIYRYLMKTPLLEVLIKIAQRGAQKKAKRQREEMFKYDEWLNESLPFFTRSKGG